MEALINTWVGGWTWDGWGIGGRVDEGWVAAGKGGRQDGWSDR